MVDEVSNEANWSADSTLDLSQVETSLQAKLDSLEASQGMTVDAPKEPSSGSKFMSFVGEQAMGAGVGYGVAVGLAAVGAGAAAPVVGAVITGASVAKGVSSFKSSADGKKKRTTRPSAMTSEPSKAAVQANLRIKSGAAPKGSIFVNGAKLKAAGKKGDLFSKMALASSTTANAGTVKAKKAPKPASYQERRKIELALGHVRRMQDKPLVVSETNTPFGPQAQMAIKNGVGDDWVLDRQADYASQSLSKPSAPKPSMSGASA